MRKPNGESHEGTFINNKLSGKGIKISKLETYKGSFKRGLYHGLGKLKYKDGRKYYGFFDNGLKHGVAKWTTSAGKIRYELWKEDEMLKEISQAEFEKKISKELK